MLEAEGLVRNRRRTNRSYTELGMEVRTRKRLKARHALVESFNRRSQAGCLNQRCLRDLGDARRVSPDWKRHYNEQRRNSSLGYSTPAPFEGRAA